MIDFEFSFVHDDVENCEFFVWDDEAEELGYFKNNGIGAGHGRKTKLMEKVKAKAMESGNEDVWRARLMDKVECVGIELRLIKFVMVIICLFNVFNMVLYWSRRV